MWPEPLREPLERVVEADDDADPLLMTALQPSGAEHGVFELDLDRGGHFGQVLAGRRQSQRSSGALDEGDPDPTLGLGETMAGSRCGDVDLLGSRRQPTVSFHRGEELEVTSVQHMHSLRHMHISAQMPLLISIVSCLSRRHTHAVTTPQHRGSLAVAGSAMGFGLTPVLAVWAFGHGLTPEAASLWRALLPALVTLPALRAVRRWPREMLLAAGAGALTGVGFAAYYRALDVVPTATATVVYYTYPLFVIALTVLALRRAPRRVELIAAGLVSVGVVLTAGPGGVVGEHVGVLIAAAIAPVTWAILLVTLATRLAALPLSASMFAVCAGGGVALAPLAVLGDTARWIPAGIEQWSAVIVLTAITRLVPALLVTWGAPRAGSTPTAVIGTLELTVAMFSAWLVTGGAVGGVQLVGIGLLIVGALVVGRSGADAARRHQPAAANTCPSTVERIRPEHGPPKSVPMSSRSLSAWAPTNSRRVRSDCTWSVSNREHHSGVATCTGWCTKSPVIDANSPRDPSRTLQCPGVFPDPR